MTEAAAEPTKEDSTPEATPEEAASEPSSPEPAPAEAAGSPEPAPEPAPAVIEAPVAIAPGEPRMIPPAYAAKTIADPETTRPSRAFLFVLATVSLVSDVASKLWAEKALEGYPGFVSVIDDHLMFILAKNKGGAWGLLQGQNENVRRPFFLLVSVAAIAFIMTLYRRLTPRQHALRWGLPLVLGGALGNVFDRVRYGHVIDFIDYRSEWVRSMNQFLSKYIKGHYVTDHWPTFNIADVAICVGVALMAVDMFTSRRGKPAGLEVATVDGAPATPDPSLSQAPSVEAAPAAATDDASDEASGADKGEIASASEGSESATSAETKVTEETKETA